MVAAYVACFAFGFLCGFVAMLLLCVAASKQSGPRF